jgi:tRNA dimethylallyltransferase
MPQPFYVVGPTGSGKSALAIALANRWGGEIVNADAFQLYQGLDICTAKPTAAEVALAPHHLYGVLAPTELCDAAFFAELAKPVIADIASRGAVPIVVGGSGLYIKALTHGLSPLPSDEGLRRKLSHLTGVERVAWLLARDPHASTTINLKNDRYVTRALEICLLTGKRQSELRKAWQDRIPDYTGICIAWDRETLHARINQRVHAMVAAGLVKEVGDAAELSATAEKAIGVREIREHVRGRVSLEDAIASIQLATRQYAQRQVKWFRREKGFVPIEMMKDVGMEELVRRVEEVRLSMRD